MALTDNELATIIMHKVHKLNEIRVLDHLNKDTKFNKNRYVFLAHFFKFLIKHNCLIQYLFMYYNGCPVGDIREFFDDSLIWRNTPHPINIPFTRNFAETASKQRRFPDSDESFDYYHKVNSEWKESVKTTYNDYVYSNRPYHNALSIYLERHLNK